MPSISHGALKSRHTVFGENKEPQLTDFEFKYIARWDVGSWAIDHNLGEGNLEERIFKHGDYLTWVNPCSCSHGSSITQLAFYGTDRSAGGSIFLSCFAFSSSQVNQTMSSSRSN